MKQERDWPSLDLQMAKKKKGSKVKESEKTLKAKSHKEMFSFYEPLREDLSHSDSDLSSVKPGSDF